MGTFHVGVVRSQKIVVLQGQWKERDVTVLISGQEMPLKTGTDGFSAIIMIGNNCARNKRESEGCATCSILENK